jgi:hypothetical protein
MAKFITPANVVKLPKCAFSHDNLWPIGTLYHHPASNTYFRFMQLGGRWDTHYAISTDRGVFVMTQGKLTLDAAPCYSHVSAPTKQAVCEMFLQFLQQV